MAILTTDHDEIRQWVEEHNGKPALMQHGESADEGVLIISFDGSDEEISWDEFFDAFDVYSYKFCYVQKVKKGREEYSYKIVGQKERLQRQRAALFNSEEVFGNAMFFSHFIDE